MKLSEYAKKNSISYRTAFRHWKAGLIRGRQLETGTIVVDEISDDAMKSDLDYVIYCRVSSSDQKEDLARQKQRLEDFCAAKGFVVKKVYAEIASGVNDKRAMLMNALDSGSNIVVEHKDRLTRFGFNYISKLLSMQGRKIIVINESTADNDIIQDFISIITSFCARIYGQRRKNRKTEELIKELKEKQKLRVVA